ncbi:MAG: NfeD family protein [Xanthomonadaceae bacterium]|nr:NfeD family protein [Xanthomonadaceae bacterium]
MIPIEPLNFWTWGIGALLLLIAEMLLPGFYLLWLGIAAALVGLLVFLWPGMPFEAQLLIFAVAAVGSIWGWRAWRDKHPEVSDQPHLNERGQHYVGKVYTLDTAIVNGSGKIRIGDTMWKVSGADLPVGTPVRVVGVDGIVMQVEQQN